MEKQELRRKVIATGLTMLGLCVVLGAAIWLLLTSKVFNSVTQWLLVGCCVLLAAAIIGFFRNKMIEIRMLRTCLRDTGMPLGNVGAGAIADDDTIDTSFFAAENAPAQIAAPAPLQASNGFATAPLSESFGFESADSEMQVQLPDFSAQPISFTADLPSEVAFQEPFVEASASLASAPSAQISQPVAQVATPAAQIPQPVAQVATPAAQMRQPAVQASQPQAQMPVQQPTQHAQVSAFQPVTQAPQSGQGAASAQRPNVQAPQVMTQPQRPAPQAQQRMAQPQAQRPVVAPVAADSDTPPVKLNVAPISWPGSPLPSRARSATAQPDFSQVAPRPTPSTPQQGSVSLADQQAALRAAHEKAAREAAERAAREDAAQQAAQAASEAAQRAADAADRASARLREAAGLNDPIPATPSTPPSAPAQNAWEKVSSDPISPNAITTP